MSTAGEPVITDPPDPTEPVISIPVTSTDPPPPTTRRQREPKLFTEAEVEAIRQQEKDKLYSRLGKADDLQAKVEQLEKEREERIKAEAAAQKEAEKVAKKKAEEELDVRQLLEKKEQEWEARLNEERAARERSEAVAAKEREFALLERYRAQLLASEEAENLMPEFRDLVQGSTKEAIDASFADILRRSAVVFQKFQGIQSGQRAAMPGSTITAPPVGPMEGAQQFRNVSVEDIRNMSMEEYAAARDALHSAARQQR